MEISASVRNSRDRHETSVRTGQAEQSLAVAPKAGAGGSAVNGGEFLMLLEVDAGADVTGMGLAATNIRYRARVASAAPDDAIAQLMSETDAVAEVHNALRAGVAVMRREN